MIILWLIFVGSVVVLPAVALLALRWAFGHGEFRNLQQNALSIFDDDEPLGLMSDRFPDPSLSRSPRADAGTPSHAGSSSEAAGHRPDAFVP